MNALLSADGIVKSFGPTRVLSGIALSIAPGEPVGLFGPNGSGKTTLVNILSGLLLPDAGTVRVLGGDRRHPHQQVDPITDADHQQQGRQRLGHGVLGPADPAHRTEGPDHPHADGDQRGDGECTKNDEQMRAVTQGQARRDFARRDS